MVVDAGNDRHEQLKFVADVPSSPSFGAYVGERDGRREANGPGKTEAEDLVSPVAGQIEEGGPIRLGFLIDDRLGKQKGDRVLVALLCPIAPET